MEKSRDNECPRMKDCPRRPFAGVPITRDCGEEQGTCAQVWALHPSGNRLLEKAKVGEKKELRVLREEIDDCDRKAEIGFKVGLLTLLPGGLVVMSSVSKGLGELLQFAGAASDPVMAIAGALLSAAGIVSFGFCGLNLWREDKARKKREALVASIRERK